MRILKRLLEKMTENNGKTTEKTTDCKRTGLGLLWRWTERQGLQSRVSVSDKLFPRASSPPLGRKGNPASSRETLRPVTPSASSQKPRAAAHSDIRKKCPERANPLRPESGLVAAGGRGRERAEWLLSVSGASRVPSRGDENVLEPGGCECPVVALYLQGTGSQIHPRCWHVTHARSCTLPHTPAHLRTVCNASYRVNAV